MEMTYTAGTRESIYFHGRRNGCNLFSCIIKKIIQPNTNSFFTQIVCNGLIYPSAFITSIII